MSNAASTFPDNSTFPIRVSSLEYQGRGFVSIKDLSKGSVILSCAPYAYIVINEWHKGVCANCLASLRDMSETRTCGFCSDAKFCSPSCMAAYDRTHDPQLCSSLAAIRSFWAKARKLMTQKNFRESKPSKKSDLLLRLASSDLIEELLDDARFITHILHKWHANEVNGEDSTSGDSEAGKALVSMNKDVDALQSSESIYRNPGTFSMGNKDYECHLVTEFERYKLLADILWQLLPPFIFKNEEHFLSLLFREKANSFGYWVDDELIGYGFLPLAAYFNHSCDNSVAKTHNSSGSMEFTLTRDVGADEEVTIYYGNPSLLADKEVAKRRRRLREHYHFECTCSRCMMEFEADVAAASLTAALPDEKAKSHEKSRDVVWETNFLSNSEL